MDENNVKPENCRRPNQEKLLKALLTVRALQPFAIYYLS